jgi:hypothetical protein
MCEDQGIKSGTDENGEVKISVGWHEYNGARYPIWCTIDKAGYIRKSIMIHLRKENPEIYEVYLTPK